MNVYQFSFTFTASLPGSAVHKMNVENRQAHTLFGVVGLFCMGHTLRMVLNLHEIFSKIDENSGNSGCYILLPFWILVRKLILKMYRIKTAENEIFLSNDDSLGNSGCYIRSSRSSLLLPFWILVGKLL